MYKEVVGMKRTILRDGFYYSLPSGGSHNYNFNIFRMCLGSLLTRH